MAYFEGLSDDMIRSHGHRECPFLRILIEIKGKESGFVWFIHSVPTPWSGQRYYIKYCK
jgi:hypothetical protein